MTRITLQDFFVLFCTLAFRASLSQCVMELYSGSLPGEALIAYTSQVLCKGSPVAFLRIKNTNLIGASMVIKQRQGKIV